MLNLTYNFRILCLQTDKKFTECLRSRNKDSSGVVEIESSGSDLEEINNAAAMATMPRIITRPRNNRKSTIFMPEVEKTYTCAYCSLILLSEEALVSHMKSRHGHIASLSAKITEKQLEDGQKVKVMSCTFCGVSFTSENMYNIHMKCVHKCDKPVITQGRGHVMSIPAEEEGKKCLSRYKSCTTSLRKTR